MMRTRHEAGQIDMVRVNVTAEIPVKIANTSALSTMSRVVLEVIDAHEA